MGKQRLVAACGNLDQGIGYEPAEYTPPEPPFGFRVLDVLADVEAVSRERFGHVEVGRGLDRASKADGHGFGVLGGRKLLHRLVVYVVRAVRVLRDLATNDLSSADGSLLATHVKVAADAVMNLFPRLVRRSDARDVFWNVLLDALALLDGVVEEPVFGIAREVDDMVGDSRFRGGSLWNGRPTPVVGQRNLVGASVFYDIRPVINCLWLERKRVIETDGMDVADGLVRDFVPCPNGRPCRIYSLSVELEG